MSIFHGPQPGGGPLSFASISATATGTPSASTFLRGDQTWAAVSGGITPSYLRYSGVAARGSTNTNTLRWSTLMESGGSDISYSSSATDGDCFIANSAGVYTVTYALYNTGGAFAAQLMAGPSIVNTLNANETEFRTTDYFATSTYHASSWTGYLAANSKIYINTGAAPNNTIPTMNSIAIARIN